MNSDNRTQSWDFDAHSNQDSLGHIAELVDASSDLNSPELAELALGLCEELEKRRLAESELTMLCYFRANAWSAIRQANHGGQEEIWAWEQAELLDEIYWLRAAIRSSGFSQLEGIRQCQILTNTANILSHIGRPIEAIEYWQRALRIIPKFAMALGNLGLGLNTYANCFYDPGHAIITMKAAYDSLQAAVTPGTFWEASNYEDAKHLFLKEAENIAARIALQITQNLEMDGFSLGQSKAERVYRRWALDNDLFLSPLNDLGAFSIAAHDILLLPDMVMPIDTPPSLIGFFNQIKQEFVSARFLYYQGIHTERQHFSDRDVALINTLDYPLYSLQIEQIKVVFRMAYSIFDKIAYFINEYWGLGIPQEKVTFRSVWYTPGKSGSIRECFSNYENLPLRGLFWLSKDFLENIDVNNKSKVSANLTEAMEPDAQALRSIRNHLEHKYLKVHDSFWENSDKHTNNNGFFLDSLACSLSRENLTAKTLRVLKLARAALIYLSLAVHCEERIRQKQRSDSFAVPMHLPIWKPIY